MGAPNRMRDALCGLLAALLPAPEREDFARRVGGEPAGWSLALGTVEFVAGGAIFARDALHVIPRLVTEHSAALAEVVLAGRLDDPGAMLALTWSGAFGWLLWALRPWTWFLVSFPIVGLVRVVAYMSSQEAVGEPFVWAGLRLLRWVRRLAGRARERRRLGPVRPDRLRRDPTGDLVLLTARLRPAWNEHVTIEIAGRFYRLRRHELRPDGAVRCHAYLLREADPNEVIRSLVRYPPAAEEVGPTS